MRDAPRGRGAGVGVALVVAAAALIRCGEKLELSGAVAPPGWEDAHPWARDAWDPGDAWRSDAWRSDARRPPDGRGDGGGGGPCAAVVWEPTIRSLLAARCTGCHASFRTGADRNGAPPDVNLDTFAGAVAVAERADRRIQAGTMPPTGGLPAAERARFAAWLSAGLPATAGDCPPPPDDTVVGGPDGPGAPDVLWPPDGPGAGDVPGGADVCLSVVGWDPTVEALLAARCTRCHASYRVGADRNGAPADVNLDSYEAAAAVAERANRRIQAGTMPPTGGLPAAERVTFAEWLTGGLPVASVECRPPARDAAGGGLDGVWPPDVPALIDAPVPLDVPPAAETCGGEVGWEPTVRALLAASCTRCHASYRVGADRNGAPADVNLDTYDAAAAVAARANARIQAGTMPPTGGLPAADRATFAAWLAGGLPVVAGRCPGADGGAGLDVPPDVPRLPGTCGSGRFWPLDGDEGPRMNPGLSCTTCHRSEPEAPVTPVAGTVYRSLDEPDRCLGVAGALVEITDAEGSLFQLLTNTSGNFVIEVDDEPDDEANGALTDHLKVVRSPVFPIRARVSYEGRVREMPPAQLSGDCNACHTWAGRDGAPGRIIVP